MQKFDLLVLICIFNVVHCVFDNCDYYEELKPRKIYNVFSPGYPEQYPAGASCRWFAVSPPNTKIVLTCDEFNIPATEDCWMGTLGISRRGKINLEDVEFYCGRGSLDVISQGNRLNIVLLSLFGNRGVFFCNITVKEPTPTPASCACGYKNSMRIVGGSETGVNEYPMMAGLVDGRRYVLFCGGSIISQSYVVTAAHCLIKRKPASVAVLVGDHDVSVGNDTDSAKLYISSKFFFHPNYDTENQKNDIALIKTEQKITFDMRVGPACLPFKNSRSTFENQVVYAVGWGTTSFGGPTSTKLLHVPLDVRTIETCKRVYGDIVTDKQLCTYKDDQDACQSDSGGPLLWTDPDSGALKLLGIISYGIQCATSHPSVNTRVASYLDWIKTTTDVQRINQNDGVNMRSRIKYVYILSGSGITGSISHFLSNVIELTINLLERPG